MKSFQWTKSAVKSYRKMPKPGTFSIVPKRANKVAKLVKDVRQLKKETEVDKLLSNVTDFIGGHTVGIYNLALIDGVTDNSICQVEGANIVNKGVKLRVHMFRDVDNVTGDKVRITVFKKERDCNTAPVSEDVYYTLGMSPWDGGFLDKELSMSQKSLGNNIVVVSDHNYYLSSIQQIKDVVINIPTRGKSTYATDDIARGSAANTYLRDNFYYLAVSTYDNTNKTTVKLQWVFNCVT